MLRRCALFDMGCGPLFPRDQHYVFDHEILEEWVGVESPKRCIFSESA